MTTSDKSGRIITFYSYKGGTGRSLALANCAWILASNGYRVLAIDWDLEAPGLHRYFHPFLIDPELTDTDGLIEYFWGCAGEALTPPAVLRDRLGGGPAPSEDVSEYVVRLDWEFPEDGCLDLLPAGRQDRSYAEAVSAFRWDQFYKRLGGNESVCRMRAQIKRDYDFVFIDSRTGVSDTSGICTVAMPDSVVALATLNHQSLEGVTAVLDSIREQRGRSFRLLPVITRIDFSEKDRLNRALRSARKRFADFLAEVPDRSLRNDTEILYFPYYSYEEVLTAFGDPSGPAYNDKSLLNAMERLTARVSDLTQITLPEIDEETRIGVLERYIGSLAKESATKEQDEPDTEAERRVIAESYFDQDLGGIQERFETAAARQRRIGLVASGVAIASGVGYASLLLPFVVEKGLTTIGAGGVSAGLILSGVEWWSAAGLGSRFAFLGSRRLVPWMLRAYAAVAATTMVGFAFAFAGTYPAATSGFVLSVAGLFAVGFQLFARPGIRGDAYLQAGADLHRERLDFIHASGEYAESRTGSERRRALMDRVQTIAAKYPELRL